jgi:hypothetical protein
MNIYLLVIGQFLRFGFRALAVWLHFADILPAEMQNTLIETAVTDLAPVILLCLTEGSSFLQKTFLKHWLDVAHRSDADTDINDVKLLAKSSSIAPIIY